MFNYPLKQKKPVTRQKNTQYEMRQERRKPVLPGPYIYVSDGTGETSPLKTWQSPEWENNFMWFDTAYVGFRHGLDGWTEFIGKLDLTLGAVTGTAAFTLPVPWRSLAWDYTFPIYMGGNDWEAGVLSVNPNGDGKVFVYWPVQTA